MKTRKLVRPEVQLQACSVDGGTLVRCYAYEGVVFLCASCGRRFDQTAMGAPAPAKELIAV